MKRFVKMILIAFLLAAFSLAYGEEKKQTKCPVMGGEINKSFYVDYQGKRIYFCCPSCKEDFLSDPEKYMKKLKDEGIVLEDAPKPEQSFLLSHPQVRV
jgi:YHS domain-containing protein